MAKQRDRLSNDEKADAKSIALCRRKADKRLENSRHLLCVNTNSSVDYLDPHVVTMVPTPQQDLTARFGIFDCIHDQIAQRRSKKKFITHDNGRRRHQAKVDSLLESRPLVLLAYFTQDRLNRNRTQLDLAGTFAYAKGAHQCIELFPQLMDSSLPYSKETQLHSCSGIVTEEIMYVLKDLKRLSEVMTRYGEQGCFKFTPFQFMWSGVTTTWVDGTFTLLAESAHYATSMAAIARRLIRTLNLLLNDPRAVTTIANTAA